MTDRLEGRTDLNIKLGMILGGPPEGFEYNETFGVWVKHVPVEYEDGEYSREVEVHTWPPDFVLSLDAQAPLVKLVEERGLEVEWSNAVANYLVRDSTERIADLKVRLLNRRDIGVKGIETAVKMWFSANAPALIRAQAFLEVLS